ncbi:unnamed protein product [Urochloa humidicola]
MAASLPLAIILLATSSVPATAGGGARMVIIRHSGGAAGARASNGGRRLEDEVAPELMELGRMLGAGGDISYKSLHPDGQLCLKDSQCAAQGRGSSTRDCTFKEHCPH